MSKNLSLLRPDVKKIRLQNKIMEQVTYLRVPEIMTRQSLQDDVALGATQFAELDALIGKENEPKYILISTDNLEMGYMAVTYLAAGFNEKHRKNDGSEFFEEFDDEYYRNCQEEEIKFQMEEWEESCWKIPIIEEHSLCSSVSNNPDPFPMDNFFVESQQNNLKHTPYWMQCTSNSICILSRTHQFELFSNNENLCEGLNYFENNDKVYILNYTEPQEELFFEEDDDLGQELQSRSKWNYIVLSFAADEVQVNIKGMNEKKYLKEVLRGILEEYFIKVKRGFSYTNVVNLIISMNDKKKCALTEKIVKYAIKDWPSTEDRAITNQDFQFMDRFVRSDKKDEPEKDKKAIEKIHNNIVGMENVKEQIIDVVNVMKFNKLRNEMKIRGGSYHNVHLMLGAPGTAKTTMAKLMGQIMMEEKLLPDNRFICINGAELKGKYVGQSAPKTKAIFENHDIILIDEAYSIVGDNGEIDSFSKESIAQLIIEIEEHSNDKLVIFAGYGGKKVSERNNKMKAFLDANPGIKSRITSTIYFDSYTSEEMVKIFYKIAENQNYIVEEGVAPLIKKYFETRVNDENFGNGREARSLLETTTKYVAKRVVSQGKKKYTPNDMKYLYVQDVEKAICQTEQMNQAQYGGDREKIGFGV